MGIRGTVFDRRCYEPDSIVIEGEFTVGADGVVTTAATKGKDVLSVAKDGDGQYTITLRSKYSGGIKSCGATLIKATAADGLMQLTSSDPDADLKGATPHIHIGFDDDAAFIALASLTVRFWFVVKHSNLLP